MKSCIRKVKVDCIRVCYVCGNAISTGEDAIKVVPKYKGRHWLCMDCAEACYEKSKEG